MASDFDTLCQLALRLINEGQNDAAALDVLAQIVQMRPEYAEAIYYQAHVHKRLGTLPTAQTLYTKAIALKPNFYNAFFERAQVLDDLGDDENARSDYERALACKPNDTAALLNLGVVLGQLNQHQAALMCYDQLLAIDPQHAGAHNNRSTTRLMLGDFASGWQEHEWRWQAPHMTSGIRHFLQPLWLGQESIAGKKILLWCEQGMGDVFQFCRYAAIVQRMGAQVFLLTHPQLLGLLRESLSRYGVTVLSEDDALPAFDFQCPLMSLPLACGTDSVDKIPNEMPYLFPSENQAKIWASRIAQLPLASKRIGLVWAGGHRKDVPIHAKTDSIRSLALTQLIPVLLQGKTQGAQFFSLQKGPPSEQVCELDASQNLITDWADDLRDWMDTTALIANLDLVISVDTSTAHVSAAMGKPTWLLSRYSGCWRWLEHRQDTPWYPSMMLFRQPAKGDWHSVVAQLVAKLASVRITA
jgi:tetratricopeptide (TPR) repeat protein